ncbi:hypothetical protein LTR08_005431 [Meristemomyces frigidus]|nr:hypothetical protein LTR08_005431 [Meristemomyces frigidus]
MDQPVERKELKSGWKNEVEVPTYSLTDVAKHKTKQDLWIVIHGRVYDVTGYARDYPGGMDALLEVAGMDATSAYEDVGHSEDAREIMQQYLVAVLAGAQSGDAAQQASTPVSHIVRRGPSEEPEKPKAGKFALGLEVAGCAVGAVGLIWVGAGAKFLSSKISFGGSDFRAFPAHKPGSIWQFVLDLPTSWAVLGLPIGQHIAVRGQVDDQTVTRSYTPISNNRDLGRLQLLIRIYPDGQLGKYMSALQAGDPVDVRGPKRAMRYRKGMSRHIGMIGGGTGITPLYQLIRAICVDKSDETRYLQHVWSNNCAGLFTTPYDVLYAKDLEHHFTDGHVEVGGEVCWDFFRQYYGEYDFCTQDAIAWTVIVLEENQGYELWGQSVMKFKFKSSGTEHALPRFFCYTIGKADEGKGTDGLQVRKLRDYYNQPLIYRTAYDKSKL